MAGLVGTKVGMTRVITENGAIIPVTLVNLAADNVVLRLLGAEGKQKIEVGALPYKRPSKNKQYRCVTSFALQAGEEFKPGDKLGLNLVQVGDKVTVKGVTKGKGFQGVMKRHNFACLPRSHGHPKDRVPGAIGCRSTPGRVYKGLRMAGHMGSDNITLKNVEIVRIDDSNKLIALKGPLPGSNGSKLKLAFAVKK